MKKLVIKYVICCLSLFSVVQGRAQSIEDYLKIAAENNPRVKAAYAQFEAALQESPQVSSLPDPTLTIGAFGKMMQTNMGTEEAKISLMQSFPWFGTLGAMEEAANLMAEAKFQDYLEVRNQLAYEVKSAYAELFEINKVIELQEENLEILQAYEDLALSQVKSGNSPLVSVVKISIQMDAALTEIALFEDQLRSLKASFNLLLNRPMEEEVVVQEELVSGPGADQISEGSLDDHPRLQRLQKQKESYAKQKEVARKQGMPQLGLGLDYTINSENSMAMPTMNGDDMYMPMLSVSIPIFRKKYKAASEEAELLGAMTEQQEQDQRNELLSTYERTKYELKKAEKLLELYERQIASSRQALELLVSAFSNSSGNFEEILDMNQSIILLRMQHLDALKTRFTAQARLAYLLSKSSGNENEK